MMINYNLPAYQNRRNPVLALSKHSPQLLKLGK